MNSKYSTRIKSRSYFRFLLGLLPRYKNYVINYLIIHLARKRGATIGNHVSMPFKLAMRANSHLFIGDHTVIQSYLIDLRADVKIGNHVIIGSDVEILTASHDIDSMDWDYKSYGLEIEDYCWLATRVFVLPSCRKIGKGAVCAAGSVIARNIESMSVVSGNPAIHLKYRKTIHSDLVVESLTGNDLIQYVKTFLDTRKNEF